MENSFLHESHLLQERETLSEQKRHFFQEKANFEKERKHFTEAAIRLGREVYNLLMILFGQLNMECKSVVRIISDG